MSTNIASPPEISKAAGDAAAKAKEAGFAPIYTKIAGQEYVYRAVTRKEWREILAARNAKLIAAGEDLAAQSVIQEDEMEGLVAMTLLYPTFNPDTIPAGTVQSLSDSVLMESGFAGPDMEAVRL